MKKTLRTIILGAIFVACVGMFVVPGVVSAQQQGVFGTYPWWSNNSGGTPPVSSSSTSGSRGSYCADFNFGRGIVASGTTVGGIAKYITCFISRAIIPLIFAIALLVFLWGMVKFIGTEGTKEKEEGRQYMLWGIIALSVMLSVWGLTKILGDTFGVSNAVPQIEVK